MPDVSSIAPTDVRLWVALDVHKLSIVAATLPPTGGSPQVQRIETTETAIRRFVAGLGGPDGLAVCYEAGPGGFALWRLLRTIGVACDIVAPSLVAVRAGDRVKTDRRDAKKLVAPHRGGLLRFVAPPTPETEGLRDLLRCRDDLRCARTAARHRVAKQLLRYGRVFGDGLTLWTVTHRTWVARQHLADPLAQLALEQMLIHLDGIERQLTALDRQLEQIADEPRWAWQVDRLRAFRGIATLTALGRIAEIGDFARFSHPDRLKPPAPGDRCERPEHPRFSYAIPTRDPRSRHPTTGHCPAVPTRASQRDSRRMPRTGRPAPAPTTTMTNNTNNHRPLDLSVHLRRLPTRGAAAVRISVRAPRRC